MQHTKHMTDSYYHSNIADHVVLVRCQTGYNRMNVMQTSAPVWDVLL